MVRNQRSDKENGVVAAKKMRIFAVISVSVLINDPKRAAHLGGQEPVKFWEPVKFNAKRLTGNDPLASRGFRG
jgi:hypothetical protein